MGSYTSAKTSDSVTSNAGSETFTFDISSAITAANIPAYAVIDKVTVTVWGDIDTATSRGKMTASFGSTTICSSVWAGGSAGEVSRSVELPVSTYFNSFNADSGKLKDSSTRLKIILDGPVMISKFKHTASWQIKIEWSIERRTLALNVSPEGSGTVTGAGTYDYYSSVTITATPNNGYRFLGWTVDLLAEPTIKVKITANMTLTAYFELDKINNILADTSQSSMVITDLVEAKEIIADTTKVYG